MLSTIYDSGECPSVRDVFTEQRRQVRQYLNDINFRPHSGRLNSLAASTVIYRPPELIDRLQWRVYHRGPFVPLKTLRERLRGNGLPIAGPNGKLP